MIEWILGGLALALLLIWIPEWREARKRQREERE